VFFEFEQKSADLVLLVREFRHQESGRTTKPQVAQDVCPPGLPGSSRSGKNRGSRLPAVRAGASDVQRLRFRPSPGDLPAMVLGPRSMARKRSQKLVCAAPHFIRKRLN
jgi:hypothetical protein